jgi:hypothetical protein
MNLRSPHGAKRNAGRSGRAARTPDYAEPVIGPRFARTRWLHAGYGADEVIE